MSNNTDRTRNIAFVEAFEEGGCFENFTRLVHEHKELELLFRGNSGDNGEAVIYYCNNVVFKLSVLSKSNTAKITINYNHLRYSADWENIIKEYSNYGFPIKGSMDIKPKENYGLGYVYSKRKINKGDSTFTWDYVRGLYEISGRVMQDFFSNEIDKCKDQFRDSLGVQTGHAKPNYLEKINQQAYFSANSYLKGGIFVYDLEYKEPFKDTEEKKKAMLEKQRVKMNKPDCLGIRFDSARNPVSFVFIEMKSKPEAEVGESGTEEHLDGMMDDLNDRIFVQTRIKEADLIIHDYQRLELKGLSREMIIPHLDAEKMRTEIVLVYTDKAASNKYVGKKKAKSIKYKDGIEYTVELFSRDILN